MECAVDETGVSKVAKYPVVPLASAGELRDQLKHQVPNAIDDRRLRSDYGFASEHVAHIGYPKPTELAQNVAPAILVVKAALLMQVVDAFVRSLKDDDHPLVESVQLSAVRAHDALDKMRA